MPGRTDCVRLLVPLLIAAALAGCGGGQPAALQGGAAPPAPDRPGDAQVRRALRLPAHVPLRATGRASDDDAEVVREWFATLTRGDVAKAAGLFAVPARFQNFSSVALIRSSGDALAVMRSLPCGGELLEVGGAGGFVVYEAELTERPGGACGAGAGGVVRGAVRVRDGRMAEWYRLPDRSAPEPANPRPEGRVI